MLTVCRRLRQGSVRARRGQQLGLAYDQVGVLTYPSPVDLLTLTSTVCVPISPLHLHRDLLRRLPRYIRSSQHDPRAPRRCSRTEPRTDHTRRRSVRFEDTKLEYVRAGLRVSEVATSWQGAPDSENAMTSVALKWIGGAIRTPEKTRMRWCTSLRLSQLAAGPWRYVWFCVLTARSKA